MFTLISLPSTSTRAYTCSPPKGKIFSRFEQVELMGRQVTLEGFDLAHGGAIVAICKDGKKSARVAIESVKFAWMTPIESRWLKAWNKLSKTL